MIASNLANALINAGAVDEGTKVLKKAALNAREAVSPDKNLIVSEMLNTLGVLQYQSGDYVGANDTLTQALLLREKTLPSNHVELRRILRNLAIVQFDLGHREESLRLARRAHSIDEETLANVLSFTSESHRLSFYYQQHLYDFFAMYGSPRDIAQSVIRTKGIVLDSLLEDRLVAEASGDPHLGKVVAEIRETKERLSRFLFHLPEDRYQTNVNPVDPEQQRLMARRDKLAAELARHISGLENGRAALRITLNQVQRNLTKDQALIEFLRYNYYLGKGKWEQRYGALIIGFSDEPSWVQLGRADQIEESIIEYQRFVRRVIDDPASLRALYSRIWAPVEALLPVGTKKIVLSPDGGLNFVSFSTLVGDDEKFLSEKYSIRYVASGRDLLKLPRKPARPVILVYANPDFRQDVIGQAGRNHNGALSRFIGLRDFQSLALVPLPGTGAEALALQKWGKGSGHPVEIFMGANATKAQLRKVSSPWVLHLATHGFFLPEMDLGNSVNPLQLSTEIPRAKLVNPMHRSGLALAGAQNTLEAWGRGEVPPTENDGILTAEEVGGLKLDGTWLVVLSACDTGLGEVRAGEGVMGLRRGFIQAGAQNLLITLWPIGDKTTVQIMLDFYEAAAKTNNAPEALGDVQRDWLVKLSRERGLPAAVRLAGPFIMSSQGKQ